MINCTDVKFYNEDLQQVVSIDDAEYLVFSSEESRKTLYTKLGINLFYDKSDDLIFQRTGRVDTWFSINLLIYYKNREIEKLNDIGIKISKKNVNFYELLNECAYCYNQYADLISPLDDKQISYVYFKNLYDKHKFFKYFYEIKLFELNEENLAFMILNDNCWKSFNKEIQDLEDTNIYIQLRETKEVFSKIKEIK